MTVETRAERVRLVTLFQKNLSKQRAEVDARLRELQAMRGRRFHGGISDDAEDAKLEADIERSYAVNQQRSVDIDAMWSLVETIFGKNDVQLAMTEVWATIGELPFVDK